MSLGEATILADGSDGPYRSGAVSVKRCEPCRLTLLDPSALSHRLGGRDLRLVGSMLDRGRTRTDLVCQSCVANFDRVTLSWGSHWTDIEECPRCGQLVVEASDEPQLRMFAAAIHRPRPHQAINPTKLEDDDTARFNWVDVVHALFKARAQQEGEPPTT